MLLTDEMRAHAYADAKAHDLPFQIFRVLGGYREALAQIATLKAQRDELLAAAKNLVDLLEEELSLGKTVCDFELIALPNMRAAIANAEKDKP